MTGKGKVKLSFIYSGRHQQEPRRRHSFTDSRDYTWDFPLGRWFRDGVGGNATPSDLQPDAFALGWMGQTGSFLGYDASGFLGKMLALAEESQMERGYTRRSPMKSRKGAALARKVRGLRGSPKAVTSLESCLMAQMADGLVSNRVKVVSVNRPLKYSSSLVDELEAEAEDEDEEATLIDNSTGSFPIVGIAVEESTFKSRLCALPKLPNLPKFLKECAVKLSTTSKAESGTDGGSSRMRVRADDSASSFSNASNCKEDPFACSVQLFCPSWIFLFQTVLSLELIDIVSCE